METLLGVSTRVEEDWETTHGRYGHFPEPHEALVNKELGESNQALIVGISEPTTPDWASVHQYLNIRQDASGSVAGIDGEWNRTNITKGAIRLLLSGVIETGEEEWRWLDEELYGDSARGLERYMPALEDMSREELNWHLTLVSGEALRRNQSVILEKVEDLGVKYGDAKCLEEHVNGEFDLCLLPAFFGDLDKTEAREDYSSWSAIRERNEQVVGSPERRRDEKRQALDMVRETYDQRVEEVIDSLDEVMLSQGSRVILSNEHCIGGHEHLDDRTYGIPYFEKQFRGRGFNTRVLETDESNLYTLVAER